MRFHLILCASLTLVCQGFPRDVASREEASLTREGIQNSPHRPNFQQEDMLYLRDQAEDSWKIILKAALRNRRVSCNENNPEGPCQRKKRRSDRRGLSYRAINGYRSSRGPCIVAADKKAITCIPASGNNKRRSVRTQHAFASIAVAPGRRHSTPAVEPCPTGSFRNRFGQCWNTMSS